MRVDEHCCHSHTCSHIFVVVVGCWAYHSKQEMTTAALQQTSPRSAPRSALSRLTPANPTSCVPVGYLLHFFFYFTSHLPYAYTELPRAAWFLCRVFLLTERLTSDKVMMAPPYRLGASAVIPSNRVWWHLHWYAAGYGWKAPFSGGKEKFKRWLKGCWRKVASKIW